MGRGFVCCRYSLSFSAVVLGISGAVVSIFSSYFIYQLYEYAPLTPDNVCGSAAVLLAMGIIICGIGWFAFQFLNFTNRSQVIFLGIALMIIMIIESGVGIWALVRHEQIDTLPSIQLAEKFALAVTDEKPTWDHMQSKLYCCGIDGPGDYRALESIPWSCCNTTDLTDDNSAQGVCTVIYKRGCQHVVINRTKSTLLHVFLLTLCSVLLHVFFIVCMCCYIKIYKKNMERRASEILEVSAREPNTGNTLLEDRSKYFSRPDSS